MTILRQDALDLLAADIQANIPELDGRVCAGPATPNHQQNYPSLVIDPIRWTFVPDQQEVFLDVNPNDAVLKMGRFDSAVRLTLSHSNPFKRAELEQKLVDMFLGSEYGPGTLKYESSECYDASVVYTLGDTEWDNEKGWDKKWASVSMVDLTIPALVYKTQIYTINAICVQYTEIDGTEIETQLVADPVGEVISGGASFLSSTDGSRAFQFTVPSDGDSFSVSIPVANMPDATYSVAGGITTIPSGGIFALPHVPDASKTISSFTVEFSAVVKAGTVVDFILRDF